MVVETIEFCFDVVADAVDKVDFEEWLSADELENY